MRPSICPPMHPAGKHGNPRQQLYPSCPVCGKATFLHHDKEHYSNYRRCDKLCNHSFFVPKPTSIAPSSVSKLFGKTDFKRMRFPVHVILMALTLFYLGRNSFRNIALILRTVINIQVSHTTISNWCTNFAPCSKTLPYRLFRRPISTPASGTLTKLSLRYRARNTTSGSFRTAKPALSSASLFPLTGTAYRPL